MITGMKSIARILQRLGNVRSIAVMCLGPMVVWNGASALAQSPANARTRLEWDRVKNGEETLRAFRPVSEALRSSVVKIDLDGNTVALGTVVDASGLVLTKASELGKGRLSCWLFDGREVPAKRLAEDDLNDVALLRVEAKNLKPVEWSDGPAVVGHWVVTPGIADLPQAVGILSVPARRIMHPRALIGVQLNRRVPGAVVESVIDGLPAKEAGLRAGDIILKLNGQAIGEADELTKKLREFREGQGVTLRVKRVDSEFDLSVNLRLPNLGEAGRGLERADRMNRMGSTPSNRAEGFALALQHDTVLQNWQCGGPLVNLDGRVVGLNIARAGRVASYALPTDLVRTILGNLRARAEVPEPRTARRPE